MFKDNESNATEVGEGESVDSELLEEKIGTTAIGSIRARKSGPGRAWPPQNNSYCGVLSCPGTTASCLDSERRAQWLEKIRQPDVQPYHQTAAEPQPDAAAREELRNANTWVALLKEYCDEYRLPSPECTLIGDSGPPHHRSFTVRVAVGAHSRDATAFSKKAARQTASEAIYKYLRECLRSTQDFVELKMAGNTAAGILQEMAVKAGTTPEYKCVAQTAAEPQPDAAAREELRNANTWVALLKEYCDEYRLPSPECTLIGDSGPPHHRSFTVRVAVGAHSRDATAFSKKAARQTASEAIYKYLRECLRSTQDFVELKMAGNTAAGILQEMAVKAGTTPEYKCVAQTAAEPQPDAAAREELRNANTWVALLKEYCDEYRLPSPECTLIGDSGPPHHRSFTVRVAVGAHSRDATAFSKKAARQTASEAIYKYLRECLRSTQDFVELKMAGNTAAGILQEMAVKAGTTPEYKCVAQTGPQHLSLFEYHCEAFGLKGTAVARSKKIAKQESAQALLLEMSRAGHHVPTPFCLPRAPAPTAAEPQPDAAAREELRNANTWVALLKEYCDEYRLPSPECTLIGDSGPPHHRSFTVRVAVGAHSRDATAFSKKAARQTASEAIYKYLRECLRSTQDFVELKMAGNTAAGILQEMAVKAGTTPEYKCVAQTAAEPQPDAAAREELRNANTWVALLKEYCDEYRLPSPECTLIGDSGPPHHRSFTVRVAVGAHSRDATAFSKKAARQTASEAIYKYLRECLRSTQDFVELKMAGNTAAGILQEMAVKAGTTPEYKCVAQTAAEPQPDAAAREELRNANTWVALLKEYCDEYRLPSPECTLIGDSGPPHHRSFTVRVAVGAHSRDATAFSKKAARQTASEAIYKYLRECLRSTQDFVELKMAGNTAAGILQEMAVKAGTTPEYKCVAQTAAEPQPDAAAREELRNANTWVALLKEYCDEYARCCTSDATATTDAAAEMVRYLNCLLMNPPRDPLLEIQEATAAQKEKRIN